MKDHLIWKEEDRKTVCQSRVFAVEEIRSRSPANCDGSFNEGTFTVVNTGDWAIVIPVLLTERGREFVMVWQWRHGAKKLSLEFPGGVFERGEDAEKAACRELREETSYIPGKITKLAVMSPNPAIMTNSVHFFLAEDLKSAGSQSLDEDEFVETVLIPEEEVLRGMGKEPFIHALMGCALSLYRGCLENPIC